MKTPATRAISPSRIVALVLVAAVFVGLTYVRFAQRSEEVVVPAGAAAGELAMEPCTYDTEGGSYAADCGTLVVPENRTDPTARLIAVPVTRIRALSDDPAEPIFRLEGGPGITNMDFENASRLAADHDVVLVGYRGVDGSSRLDCPEVDSAIRRADAILGEDFFRSYADAFRSCAERLTAGGADLAGYGILEQVDDLEAARRALGYDRIDLVSESAGTRTALIYSWRHPESLHRSVMIGANPPGHFLWDPATTDEQIRRYAELCAKDADCSRRTGDLVGSMRRTVGDMASRWLFLPIDETAVRIFSFYGFMESTPAASPLAAPPTIDSWFAAAEGDTSGFWLKSVFSDVFPIPLVWGQWAAFGRPDSQAARDYFAEEARQDQDWNLGRDATAFTWGGGRLVDAWPAVHDEAAYDQVRPSDVETLVVGGTLDVTTPPQVATRELMPYLTNGRQVVLGELAHTVDFWNYQPEASTRLLTAFFDTGEVDDSLYTAATVDFTPEVTLPGIAKIVLATMIGLALVALLSLVLMWRRIRRRGGFGSPARAILRSVYPVVLGLGGWCLAALGLMAASRAMPVDDPVVVVISAAVPIAFGIYLAWVRPEMSPASRSPGWVAATAGAVAGAWFGFGAASSVLGLLAAIAGAIAGANLALVAFDIVARGSEVDVEPGPVPQGVVADLAEAERETVGVVEARIVGPVAQ